MIDEVVSATLVLADRRVGDEPSWCVADQAKVVRSDATHKGVVVSSE